MLIGLLILIASGIASLIAVAELWRRLAISLSSAPLLASIAHWQGESVLVSVVIPAYNEGINIEDCLRSVLASQLPMGMALQVIAVDDGSEDQTRVLCDALAQEDHRLLVLTSPARPAGELWLGKNWACAQVEKIITGDYVLFIDADVRLGADAVAKAVAAMEQKQIDLLTVLPEVRCGCWSEWLVQPIMMALLAVGFRYDEVNCPQSQTAFAAGPFMLFRRSAYAQIGGHSGVADNLVEDVALARQIKKAGLKLFCMAGFGMVFVRMYQSFAGLWEGWTKNFHMGTGRKVGQSLYASFVVFLVFTLPWLLPLGGWFTTINLPMMLKIIVMAGLSLPLLLHLALRIWTATQFRLPYGIWLVLGWLGGLLVSAISIVSIIKTETGIGWTWRGRQLKIAPKQVI
jgi:cellulose synthase/poly-beta-1,6-N-acetylglucosamine synthase-like glycosyltransferase